MWDLDPDSLPGPDGYPDYFFRCCWNIITGDFERTVRDFFTSRSMPLGMNNNLLVLIPKINGDMSLDKFRPLCMGNFFCKVISKILATRLSFLPRLISEEQRSFQKGKLIHNNIALASKLANIMHSSIRGGRLGAKIDIQKAFDTISWDFILKALKKFGFFDIWLKWISQILSTSKISILLNGGPVGYFGVERGSLSR
ncbi:uncharacterized protein LOC122062816 [Macadamia integrifolia]|uniref:uncharacterized protein LOC122062816 n=1 Tax=Macadamia integrifolia TaxID=60698 RepID=UPI001C4EBC1C|nr:uncharacterized protein LOC122062816 [Macadamia integrifolia]